MSLFVGCSVDSSPLFRPSDPPTADPMETEAVVGEGARGDADDVVVIEEADGTDDPAGGGEAEAAKAAAAADGEGTGDRADGPGEAGASSTLPSGDPAAAAVSGPEEPPAGAYLKAGDGVFIRLPWEPSSRAPVEGEALDREVLASVGLTVVDAPSTSSGEPEEERLLRKLVSLYRARQAKVERQEALVARAGADMEKCAGELREINKKLSGLWRRSGGYSTRRGRPFSSRRQRPKSSRGLPLRGYPRGKANWCNRRPASPATRRRLPRASRRLAGPCGKRRTLPRPPRSPRGSWRRGWRNSPATSRRAARSLPRSNRSARRALTPLASCRAASPRRSRSSTPPRTPRLSSS